MNRNSEDINREIWRLLDGELTKSEIDALNQECADDPDKKEELKLSQDIHDHLGKMYNYKAPARILKHVLSKVDDIKILEKYAARSVMATVVIMLILGTSSLFIPEENSRVPELFRLDWIRDILTSQAFSLLALTSIVFFAFMLFDYFVLRRRVPR